ncbi:hypothetical protein ACFV98_35215 [Streptomyces violascens]|uniref:hypothetical protein n=1 Tax=Streptomyces violascens TaxID=67381 RepID=UPI003663588D
MRHKRRGLDWDRREKPRLRGAASALRGGERHVRRPGDGKEFDAARLLTREVPYCALEFAAALLPGWLSRGYTWPPACARRPLLPCGDSSPRRP